jgi:hypothetical protein
VITVSARRVTLGHGIPPVCRRHGHPATHRLNLTVESSPAGWSYALLLAGLLPFAIVRALTRLAIRAAQWPFCDRCRRGRRIVATVALVIMAAGVIIFASGITAEPQDFDWSRILAGLVVMIVGYVGLHWARLSVIAGLRLTRDGQRVEIRNPSAEFEARLPAEDDLREQTQVRAS